MFVYVYIDSIALEVSPKFSDEFIEHTHNIYGQQNRSSFSTYP